MKVIDFHAHAFPDTLATRVVPQLAKAGGIIPALDGTIAALLASMDRAGVERSVICSILTKPTQYEPVLKWSLSIASDRIVPFGSVHPDDPKAADRVREIAANGLLGIKMHPFYQEFVIDEDRMMPIYEAAEKAGLIMLLHAGYDVGYAPHDRATPERTARVKELFPDLQLIAAHVGGWREWDAVERHLLGRPVYLDMSWSLPMMDPAQARRILTTHPAGYLVFGSDSPWADQTAAIEEFQAVGLPEELQAAILYDNAARLLAGTAKTALKGS